jgi:signal transduction histidine kinase
MTGSEFKKIEKNQLDEIFDSIPSGLLSLSRNGKILELNRYAECTIAKVREVLLDKDFDSLLSTDSVPLFKDFLTDVFESNQNEFCEVTIENESGFPVYALLMGRVPKDRDDCFVALIDISSHRNKLDILEESNNRFQNLGKSVSAHVAYIDAKTLKYEYVNDLYSKSLQIPHDKIIGSHVKEIIGEKNYEFAAKFLNKVIGGESVSYENRFKIDSQERWFKINYSPVFNSENKVTSIAVLIYDMNDLKIALEESNRKIDEVSRLNTELGNYLIANEELKQFAYVCSHRLQEPGRTISNFVNILEEEYSGKMDENELKYFQVIKGASRRMHIIIDSLLEFTKLDNQKKRTLTDINSVICNAVSKISGMIQSSGAFIETCEMPTLNVYEIELQQMFQNLISNAIKFQRKGSQPKVTISAEQLDKEWKFSITDNGIGISQAYFEKIFEIFQRLHIGEDEYEGKGIGLAYCKKVALMHGGRIWVESVPDKGSAFSFTIPAV